MILFFRGSKEEIYTVAVPNKPSSENITKLNWLFGKSELIETSKLEGFFIGPRREMVTPWSTNAVEITQNMSVPGINRIEQFKEVSSAHTAHDLPL